MPGAQATSRGAQVGVRQGTGGLHFGTGQADRPDRRSLVEMRKRVKWFSEDGQVPAKKHGLVGVGAIPYMTNFNITLDTSKDSCEQTKIMSIFTKANVFRSQYRCRTVHSCLFKVHQLQWIAWCACHGLYSQGRSCGGCMQRGDV